MKITCRCLTCGNVQIFTEDDPIDEAGPSCEKCIGPMVAVRAEVRRKTERDTEADRRFGQPHYGHDKE